MATDLQFLGSLTSVPGVGIVAALGLAVVAAEIVGSIFRFLAELTVGRLDPLGGLVVREAVLGLVVAVGWQKLAPFANMVGGAFRLR